MYANPIVPSDPKDLPRFLQEELSRLSDLFQAMQLGQEYPNSNASTKTQYWDDILAPLYFAKAAGLKDPTFSALQGGVSAWAFSAAAENELFISLHIPHTYKPNSKVYPHVHWTTTGTNAGVVRWGLEYTVARGHNQASGGNFGATTTIFLEQAASGTARRHMITEASDAQAFSTNLEPDSLVLMRIYRDATHANDTCTDAAFGLFADLHFQKSYWATKNKAPDFYG